VNTEELVASDLDVTVAARLSDKVSISRIALVDIRGQLHDVSRKSEYRLSYEVRTTRIVWGRVDPSTVRARFKFGLDMSVLNSEDEETRLAQIHFIAQSEYSVAAEDVTDEDLRHFIGIVGYMHAYPYFRAEVQGIVAKLELPPLTLPVVVSGAVPQLVSIGQPARPSSYPKQLESELTDG
jgi:hypothetical protein